MTTNTTAVVIVDRLSDAATDGTEHERLPDQRLSRPVPLHDAK